MMWPVLIASSITACSSGETRYSPANWHLLDASVLWTVTRYWFRGRVGSERENTGKHHSTLRSVQSHYTWKTKTFEQNYISQRQKCTPNTFSYKKKGACILLISPCEWAAWIFQGECNPLGNKKKWISLSQSLLTLMHSGVHGWIN